MYSVIGAAEMAAAVLLALINVVTAAESAQSPRNSPMVLAFATQIQAALDDQVAERADRAMRIVTTSVRENSIRGLWNGISTRFKHNFAVAKRDDNFKVFYSQQTSCLGNTMCKDDDR